MVVLKNDYSHCPLKKRPLSVCYESSGGEQTEPQDLSLKCGKEAPSIPPPEDCTSKEYYPQDAQMRSIPMDTCDSSTDSEHSLRASSSQEVQKLKDLTFRLSSQKTSDSCIGRSLPEQLMCPQDYRDLDVLSQRRYTQVIRMHDSKTENILPLSSQKIIKSEGASERSTSPKHVCRKKDSTPFLSEKSSDGSKDAQNSPRNAKFHPSLCGSSNLVLPTCSQSIPQENVIPERVTFPPRVPPPLNHVITPRLPLALGQLPGSRQLPGSVPAQSENVSCTAQGDKPLRIKCTSPNSSAPHRPWLSEGPAKMSSIPHPGTERIPPMPQGPHPQSLLVGPSGLWGGMVPFSWPMAPILTTPQQPLSPKRIHHRECYSPGSESASSDGSSGGGSNARNETRYSCTDCNKSYSTYSGLSKHKQFHCAALGAKSFACKHCDKVYTSLGALKMHIRTHTLPCKCPLCGKAFSRPWLLQGHIRTHTGEKPFQCPQCDRCFADRSNLRAHLQTHADIKKYACNTCHKTFSRMSLLNKHTEAACPALQRRSL